MVLVKVFRLDLLSNLFSNAMKISYTCTFLYVVSEAHLKLREHYCQVARGNLPNAILKIIRVFPICQERDGLQGFQHPCDNIITILLSRCYIGVLEEGLCVCMCVCVCV